ncbi:hypothetical protein V6N13_112512 [Hibiscus sabdariffa]
MEDSSKRSTFCLQNLFLLMFHCLFFFIQYLVSPVTGDFLVTPYDPMENITIDCGSSTGGQSRDPRPWFGEGDGKFSLIDQSDNKNKSLAIKAANQLPSSFALQSQELVEEGIRPNPGAGIGGDIDNASPFTAKEMEDDSGEVFSSIGDHVMNSRSISTFSLTTSDEPSFITEDSDKNPSKAVFSEIRDPQGR